MGFNPRFSITHAITAGLTRIERARGFLEAATLSDEWVRAMEERALVLEAHHTTHIEGSELTLEQSKRLWAGEAVPEADPEDVRELLNYRRAFDFVSKSLDSGSPVTEDLIREIHRRLVEGVRGGEASPGRYRETQNYIVNSVTRDVIYTPPPPDEVPGLMAELVTWLDHPGEVHPVLTSGVAQFQLVHIHPFRDGNGRASRLLSTLCLYRAGYDFKRLFTISEYYDRSRPLFYRALQSVRERDMDLTEWLEYFVGALATQLREVTERGKKAMRGDLMARRHALNERQTKALAYLFEHEEMDIGDLEALCQGVNRRTLQRDLLAMEELGLIGRIGAARGSRYVLGEEAS